MAPKPKPCPFCDGTNIVVERDNRVNYGYVVCKRCGMRGPESASIPLGDNYHRQFNDDEAIRNWNALPREPYYQTDIGK